MKTFAVGAVGIGASFTIERYSQVMGAISITLTTGYMVMKWVEWAIAKRIAKHEKNCKKKHT
jgi:hypothetical protein